MKSFVLAAALASTILGGCAHPPPGGTPPSNNSVSIKRDEYKKLVTIDAAPIRKYQSTVRLRGVKSTSAPDAEPLIGLFAVLIYDDYRWRFFESADTIDGRSWPTKVVTREVTSCSRYGKCTYTEVLTVSLPAEYLRASADQGINIQISGKSGAEQFLLPSSYISSFLSSL